jgi:hypothetical protein
LYTCSEHSAAHGSAGMGFLQRFTAPCHWLQCCRQGPPAAIELPTISPSGFKNIDFCARLHASAVRINGHGRLACASLFARQHVFAVLLRRGHSVEPSRFYSTSPALNFIIATNRTLNNLLATLISGNLAHRFDQHCTSGSLCVLACVPLRSPTRTVSPPADVSEPQHQTSATLTRPQPRLRRPIVHYYRYC